MKLNAYQLKEFRDNPLARVLILKKVNPTVYSYLSDHGFNDSLLDQLLLIGKEDVAQVLYENLSSPSSLLRLKFKPQQIARIMGRYAQKEKFKVLNKHFDDLRKYCTMEEIVKMAELGGGCKTIEVFCSNHYQTLFDNDIKPDQIKKLAIRLSGSHFLIALSRNIKNILSASCGTLTADVLYNSVSRLTSVCGIEDKLKQFCKSLHIEYVSDDNAPQENAVNVLMDEHVKHIDKKQKIELPQSDEQIPSNPVFAALVNKKFTHAQLNIILATANGANILRVIEASLSRFRVKITNNRICEISAFEGAVETIEALCSQVCDTLYRQGYSSVNIIKLASRTFGSRFMSVLAEYSDQLIKVNPKLSPSHLFKMAIECETAEILEAQIKVYLSVTAIKNPENSVVQQQVDSYPTTPVQGQMSHSTSNLLMFSTNSPVNPGLVNQSNDVIENVGDLTGDGLAEQNMIDLVNDPSWALHISQMDLTLNDFDNEFQIQPGPGFN